MQAIVRLPVPLSIAAIFLAIIVVGFGDAKAAASGKPAASSTVAKSTSRPTDPAGSEAPLRRYETTDGTTLDLDKGVVSATDKTTGETVLVSRAQQPGGVTTTIIISPNGDREIGILPDPYRAAGPVSAPVSVRITLKDIFVNDVQQTDPLASDLRRWANAQVSGNAQPDSGFFTDASGAINFRTTQNGVTRRYPMPSGGTKAAAKPAPAQVVKEAPPQVAPAPKPDVFVSTPSGKIGEVIRDCPDCPAMVAVPQVGHTAANPGKIFYAGRYEVTWKDYLVAVREGACPIPAKSFGGLHDIKDRRINDNYPLTRVGVKTFDCYLDWLHKKTGKTYRIPSAAEWEHIARAGTTTDYYWGDGIGFNNAMVFDYFDFPGLKSRLGYPANNFLNDPRWDVKFESIFPVGQFEPNPWGLYDVIGNVAEFTTEVAPTHPGCLKIRSEMECAGLYARGADRIRSPRPSKPNPPITESLTTARYGVPTIAGMNRAGFRLVRDN